MLLSLNYYCYYYNIIRLFLPYVNWKKEVKAIKKRLKSASKQAYLLLLLFFVSLNEFLYTKKYLKLNEGEKTHFLKKHTVWLETEIVKI